MAEQQQQDKRTATQKITNLEEGLTAAFQTIRQMANDVSTCKEAIKLLGNKLDAVVKASSTGQALTDDVISKIMVDNNVEELKNKVTNLVTQGFLVAQDQPTDNSFLVGREEDKDGKVANPRLQFVLSELTNEDFRNKLKAAKIGDVVFLEEDKLRFVLLESYAIETPKPALAAVPQLEQPKTVVVDGVEHKVVAVDGQPVAETTPESAT